MATLNVLGCGDAFNSGGRRHTSFLLQIHNFQILIDCGATTGLSFKQTGHFFNEVNCVIITHFHGDHYGGLPFLILEAAKVHKRKDPLLLVSPPGLKNKLYDLMKLLYNGSEDALETFPIHYIEYERNENLSLPFGTLHAKEVQHTPESLPHGIRLEVYGKIFSYSGDTSWHPNLIKLAEGADLFICECNFCQKESDAHLNYYQLKENLEQLKASKIYLTHLGDKMLEKQEELVLEVLKDGQQIHF